MRINKSFTGLVLGVSVFAGGLTSVQATPLSADVVFIVDESGSMSAEHTWMNSMIGSLESGLIGQGVGANFGNENRYAIVGYGGNNTHGVTGHTHAVGGSNWGNAVDAQTASGTLIASGGYEDGYEAIDFFFSSYTLDNARALNIILITDEDRDFNNGTYSPAGITYASVLSDLTSNGALLNAVINCDFTDDQSASAIGVDSTSNAYVTDGNGGYTSNSGGQQNGLCTGNSKTDYADLAWASGGAAWDLGLLRAGGNSAASFTSAFIDIKVQEITQQLNPVSTNVPEPGTLALMGLGIIGVGAISRRKKTKMNKTI